MNTVWLKKLSGWLTNGQWFSGHPVVEPMVLERDWSDIERLLHQEQWPFVRTDFELSHAQPKAIAMVARKQGAFAGFYTTHHFGDVGYLDMMVIADKFRRSGVARPLHFTTLRTLRKQGIRSLVVHSTNDSARLLRLLGFRSGQDFTLLVREPVTKENAPPLPQDAADGLLKKSDIPLRKLIDLDAEVFGMRREHWQRALYHHPDVDFWAWGNLDQVIQATLCVRSRREHSLCIDQVNVRNPRALVPLVDAVLLTYATSRLECFAKTGSALHHLLLERGFGVPAFFKPIGPLVEWRKGNTAGLGTSAQIQTLNWL
jgi:N-acetylglutamate synthase-like GNAT family acetyltransferase